MKSKRRIRKKERKMQRQWWLDSANSDKVKLASFCKHDYEHSESAKTYDILRPTAITAVSCRCIV